NLFYSWQFGVGATPATSSSSGPISVSYSSDGMKTITLIVANTLGLDTISQTIFVQPQPTAGFTATSTGANTFDFTNTSTGINTQTWDFGDGNTSTLANPSHTYMANGAYQVKLYGVGDCGTDSANQFITVTGITVPTADFVADNGNLICEGDSVTFTDMSTGISITSYDWFFGLGANPTTANTPGPHTVVYTIGGTKTISLTVTNSEGANVKSTMITVDSLPVADYSYSLSGGFQTYAFTNNSLAGVTYNWDFGDGNLSGDKNPVHTFTTNGSYDVTLVIENSCGKDTMIQTIDITNVGISQALSGVTVRVFPNPNKGVFQLQIEGSDPARLEGEIVDIRGRTIQKLDIEHLGLVSQHAVQLSVAKGIYILNLKKGNQETHLRILVD
ncbi:MAG: PKD domain-containing protein, partial [Bacteroidetes bacterium]|nr:PKD domain-containing protein [Bacteroidota bacterium]